MLISNIYNANIIESVHQYNGNYQQCQPKYNN